MRIYNSFQKRLD